MERFKLVAKGLIAVVLLSCLTTRLMAADLVSGYFSGLQSFEADFTQTVIDANGEMVQDSKGRVWIQRPGRFRWDYETPYRQQIVADGRQMWTYDEDLEQATVKEIDEALSSTPAMLLSSYRPLAEVMDWQQTSSEAGITWYRLDPKQKDAAVEEIRIAFDGRELGRIQVLDGFGNRTEIRFLNGKRNKSISADRFRFSVPAGTDIIGTPE